MVSAFASDGAGGASFRPAGAVFRRARHPGQSGTSGALAGAGGHRMTDALSSTLVPGRRGGTERLDPPFLDGKLQIPRPGFPVLPRRRVHALLDRATRHRVTLVSGPRGAGETGACASWAALRPAAGRG